MKISKRTATEATIAKYASSETRKWAAQKLRTARAWMITDQKNNDTFGTAYALGFAAATRSALISL